MTTSQSNPFESVLPPSEDQFSADLTRLALTASRDVLLQTGFACLQAPQHAAYLALLQAGWEPVDPLLESYLRFVLAPHHPEAGYALALQIEDRYPAQALLALRLAASLHSPLAALRFARMVRTRSIQLSEAWLMAADMLFSISARHEGKRFHLDVAVRHLVDLALSELQLHNSAENQEYWQELLSECMEDAGEGLFLHAAWLARYEPLMAAPNRDEDDEAIAAADSMFPRAENPVRPVEPIPVPTAVAQQQTADAAVNRADPSPVSSSSGPRHALIQSLTPPRGAREIEEIDLRRFEQLKREGAILLPMPDLDQVMETLSAEFPWMARVTEAVGRQLAAQRMGDGVFRLRPLLLYGPPGSGKTRFARRLAELAQIPFLALAVGGASDNRALRGTARGWGTATPSLLLSFLVQEKVANPLILLDELDKDSESRRNGRVSDTLHQLLERENSKRWYDEFLLGSCDFSPINWIATANQIDGIDQSLRSRVHCISVPLPKREHYPAIVDTARQAFATRIGLPVEALPAFDVSIQRMLARNFQSPRQAVQATERVLEILLNERRRLLH
ncbi:AAA family ATPase [Thermithiobacillus plumbiphilus]|uniref:AAA family ATPase n=1 Tax=Thermithiobacillus plumbiphilus TaxID=1729899 RepID=A0ABU9D5B4_9PROT